MKRNLLLSYYRIEFAIRMLSQIRFKISNFHVVRFFSLNAHIVIIEAEEVYRAEIDPSQNLI